MRAGSLPTAGRPHVVSRILIRLTPSLPTSSASRPRLVTFIDEHDDVASFQVASAASMIASSVASGNALVPAASIVTKTQLDSQCSGLPPSVGPGRTKPAG